MAQHTINESKTVSGNHEAFNAETGQIFINNQGRTAFSLRGLRIALNKSGHTYPQTKAKVPKAKAPKVKATERVDLSEDQLLTLFEECKTAAGLPLPEGADKKTLNWKAADTHAQASGINFYALRKVVNGIRHSRKTPEVRAQHEESAAKLKAKRVTKVPSTSVISELQNNMARLNNYKRFRDIKRAADRGDSRAIAVKAMIEMACSNATEQACELHKTA